MNIKLFRLITGEDIITEVKENLYPSETQVILEKPVQIVLQKDGEQMSVAFVPYMPMINGDVIVNKNAIVSEGNPDPELVSEYNRRFGSGIVLAGADALAQLG